MGDKPDYVNGEPKPIPNNGPSMHDLVSKDLQERKDYGLNKYDSLLQAFNGRNFLQDIYEEMQDGIVYLRGALAEQEAVSNYVRKLLTGWAKMYAVLYPEDGPPVIEVKDNLPGWMVKIHEEVLGDGFIYRPEDAGVPEGSR